MASESQPRQLDSATVNNPSGRQRHHLFKDANRLARTDCLFYDNAWGQLERIRVRAAAYHLAVQDKGIVLINPHEEKVAVHEYYTRFSPGFYEAAISRIRKYSKVLAADSNLMPYFMSFTIDPKRVHSLYDAYSTVQGGFNRLLTAMKKRYGVVRFIKVVEFQGNGSPHLHVLMFLSLAPGEELDYAWVTNLWFKKYGIGADNIKKIDGRGIKGTINYITWYMKKSMKSDDHLALLWSLDARAYSHTRAAVILDKSAESNSNSSGWLYLGSMPLAMVQDLTWAEVLDIYESRGGFGS